MFRNNKFDFVSKKRKITKKEVDEDSEDNPLEDLGKLFKPPQNFERDRNHIYFYTDVDQDTCLNLNRKINDLNRELLKDVVEFNTPPPAIYLHINSGGGSLFAAFSTIDTIMNSKIPIVSIIEGCAASAATIISMVCHKRYITPNSFMLIHQLSTGVYGKFEEIKDNFINDEALMKLLYKLYNEHTSMDNKTIKTVLKRDIWWTADECLEHGLVDDIWKNNLVNVCSNPISGAVFDSTTVNSSKSFPVRTSLTGPLTNEVVEQNTKTGKRKRMIKIYDSDDDSDSDDEDKHDSVKETSTSTSTETEKLIPKRKVKRSNNKKK